MNIALISNEFPFEFHGGGIGTFMGQKARLLVNRGHHVEVFCSSKKTNPNSYEKDGIVIHPVPLSEPELFREKVLPYFEKRIQEQSFDIIEGPDYRADSLKIREKYPYIPHMIKLHGPNFWIQKLSRPQPSIFRVIRYRLGGLRRGKWEKKPFWKYYKELDPEYQISQLCPIILHPSELIKNMVIREWGLENQNFIHVPNPFIPSQNFLSIPINNKKTNAPSITFIGSLYKLKGIVELCEAMPYIFEQYPNAALNIVGTSLMYWELKMEMHEFIKRELAPYKSQLNFTGQVSYEKISDYLAKTDICIFPSLWDNFPTVCLEAMSAGRAIVGSQISGMKEMLTDDCGILVNPHEPKEMAKAIIKLIKNPDLRDKLGQNARKKVLEKYNQEVIGQQAEEAYQKVINHWSKCIKQHSVLL